MLRAVRVCRIVGEGEFGIIFWFSLRRSDRAFGMCRFQLLLQATIFPLAAPFGNSSRSAGISSPKCRYAAHSSPNLLNA